MKNTSSKTPANTRINAASILFFYIISFVLSAPANSFYFIDQWQQLTHNTLLYNIPFLPAGIGTLLAALSAFKYHKKWVKTVTLWGNNPVKNIVLSLIPLMVFTVTGINNNLDMNNHVYALVLSVIVFIYAFSEEIFWRGYLINALQPLGWAKNYLLLGVLWWFWHFNFLSSYGLTTFLLLIVGSSFLIGKFAEGTRSYLTTTGLHSLIVILTIGNNQKPLLYAAGIVILLWVLTDKLWKRTDHLKPEHQIPDNNTSIR